MASPCELLIASFDKAIASEILAIAVKEARRIEAKYSRFITHNPLWHINHSDTNPVAIDDETYRLLTFAQQCFELSDGRFDITAGPLMKLWRFEEGENAIIPDDDAIQAAKALIDFSAVQFSTSTIVMPTKMNLDLGGIAKEYAVDSAANLIANRWPTVSVLVNFGGDIACPVTRDDQNPPWQVGIENPDDLDNASAVLQIRQGALATSGDTRRFIERNGKRYGHIIDPSTGFPVELAPRSVTVLAQNCVMAGMLSTMAMLEGSNAESFLSAQGVYFKVYR
ncbi:FAD:protein FMN transferase [Shewanella mesophila]|uniref:FAD:protein FMN transferase n=1 Tax=Shewanella mesophila TaxID=2864208 RepID=UPI001C6618CF|nr:FAD:protein FMN transferase [Shewanella mesophila]QYJ87897.1 FAD:protein FMN transferase [Shewanella mesophila]